MMRTLLTVTFVALLVAPRAEAARCKNPNRPDIAFTLDAGGHDGTPWRLAALKVGTTFTRTLAFQVRFADDVRYATVDPVNQWDWNKLMGFTTYDNHQDSIRLGWRYNPATDRVELGYYGYLAGVRTMPMLTSVAIGEWADVSMTLSNNGMSLTANGHSHGESGSLSAFLGIPWLPVTTVLTETIYFGGDEVAQQTIHADVRGVVVDRPCQP